MFMYDLCLFQAFKTQHKFVILNNLLEQDTTR